MAIKIPIIDEVYETNVDVDSNSKDLLWGRTDSYSGSELNLSDEGNLEQDTNPWIYPAQMYITSDNYLFAQVDTRRSTMAFNRATDPVYAKGTMDVWCWNPATGDLDYYSNKIQTNQFQTNVNLSPVNAGVGNPVVINLPDTSEATLTITAADVSLAARKLSVGGNLAYNGVIPFCESIKASGTSLQVSNSPVAGYGMSAAYAWIDNDGTAYEIDTDSFIVKNFVATADQTYTVRYFMRAASAQELRISSVFAPAVEVVMMRIPAYSAQGSTANQGSHCGDFYIWIPRMQFNGNAATDASQTAASTTDISGTALSYDEAVATGVCDAESQYGALAYMVYMPLAGATSAVEGLAVVGGGVSVSVGNTVQIPVKYAINGQLVQPNYADLTFTSSATGTASVGQHTGVVTGVQAGSADITVALDEPAYTLVVPVTVTAS